MKPDPLSLRALQHEYLVGKLREVARPPGLYALVLDRKTEAAVLAVVAKDELLRIVTTVELIDARRRLSPYLQAVYLVEPLVYNLNCIVADVHTARYKLGHGLFLPFLQWDEQASRMFQLAKFLQNPDVLRYFDGGRAVAFVHACMVPAESRVFLVDRDTPNAMPIYWNENCADLVLAQIRRSARAIVNAVVVAGEYPLVRFYALPESTHQAARLPEILADEVQRQLDDYCRANADYPPQAHDGAPRAILLICDRTLDLFAPLLHEFTYQAMAMDIVEGLERRGRYTFTSENEKGETSEVDTTLDSEDDETWVALRHTHIIEASELIISRISDLIKNNPMMVDRAKAKTSSDLMYVVAHLLGFDTERREVTLHKTLIDECLDINATRKLAEFAADFEQTCTADGTLFEGVRSKNLHGDLVVLLARDDLHVNDKVRLVLIYALYRGGLVEADFVKLARFIGVKDNQIVSLVLRCFFNLHKMDFPIVKKSTKDKKVVRQTFHTINNDGTYNTSRFAPGIKRVLYNAARYELDENWFPYFRDKPLEDDAPSRSALESSGSLRNARIKASWAPASKSGALPNARNRQRIFCFVAGGVTLSEVRSVYELSNSLNKDFFLGSECILKPRDFLIGLQSIDDVKNLDNLDIPLSTELSMAISRAPDHLFEVPKPPPVAAAPPSSSRNGTQSSASHSRSSSGKSRPSLAVGGGFGQLIVNPQLPHSEPSASAPLHYQKRVNQYATDISPDSPTKDKKLSRLKRLFK